MDLEKLEKLSCLKIKEENKEKIINGINSVWLLMEELNEIKVKKVEYNELNETVFNERKDIFVDKEDGTSGIKIFDGKFDAPRVVRKK